MRPCPFCEETFVWGGRGKPWRSADLVFTSDVSLPSTEYKRMSVLQYSSKSFIFRTFNKNGWLFFLQFLPTFNFQGWGTVLHKSIKLWQIWKIQEHIWLQTELWFNYFQLMLFYRQWLWDFYTLSNESGTFGIVTIRSSSSSNSNHWHHHELLYQTVCWESLAKIWNFRNTQCLWVMSVRVPWMGVISSNAV